MLVFFAAGNTGWSLEASVGLLYLSWLERCRPASFYRSIKKTDNLSQWGESGLPAAHVHFSTGKGHLDAQEFEAAVEAFEQATDVDPSFSKAWYWLGVARGWLERNGDAAMAFKRLIALRPSSPLGYAGLAMSLLEGGCYDEAEDQCRKALELDVCSEQAQDVMRRLRNDGNRRLAPGNVKSPNPHVAVRLSNPTHYDHVFQEVGGARCRLFLIMSWPSKLSLILLFHWDEDLESDEADQVDSRARAFVSCAIFDAAKKAGLECKPLEPHGNRPSWDVCGLRYSLLVGRCDARKKQCRIEVGPVFFENRSSFLEVNTALAFSFQRCFREITV